jgi:uncharacterized membrane protein
MNTNQKNVGRDFRGERHIASLLLILGFLLLLPGLQLFNISQNYLEIPDWARSIDRHAWERNLVSAGVAVTLLGLVVLEGMLRQAGDRILSRLALVAFTLGTAMWLTVNALNLNGGSWVAEVETYFIVFAFLANASYSGAILRTRLLPLWIRIAAILWSFEMLMFVLPGDCGPLFYEPALLLIAIALLLTKEQVLSQG